MDQNIMSEKIDQLAEHYDSLVKRYGTSPESAQWSDRKTQHKRFSILSQICEDITGASILDLGCGTGELYRYLKEYQNFSGRYIGIDISNKAIDIAQKSHPEQHFECRDITLEPLQEKVDYVIISGLFNNKLSNWEKTDSYMWEILPSAFAHANKGIAFNAMSTYVDYEADNLNYFSPETVYTTCMKYLSPLVTLRHDYRVKESVIPFEFTIYVFHNSYPRV